MRDLARLHADAVDTTFTRQKQLEAQYAYASFLEAHSTQVFFNDMLWYGFQTWAFLQTDSDQGYTRAEREFFLRQERRLKDEQEERWRAYKILAGVVDQAGNTELGRRAAGKALTCLRLIHTGRFGREEEIRAAIARLEKRR